MAIYEYRGINRKSKNVRGIIDASTAAAARDKLKSQGIYLQEIHEAARVKRKLNLSLSLSRKRATLTSIICIRSIIYDKYVIFFVAR